MWNEVFSCESRKCVVACVGVCLFVLVREEGEREEPFSVLVFLIRKATSLFCPKAMFVGE